MRTVTLLALLSLLCALPIAAADKAVKPVSVKVPENAAPIVLRETDSLATVHSFKPPVEITLVAKTDSTNIRMSYAANQIIFNWEVDPTQLRVDGGPADQEHKAGAGEIPVNKYVTIKWLVTLKKQSVFVDGQLRYEHEGDYSQINRPFRIFTREATISLKSLDVKQLPVPKD